MAYFLQQIANAAPVAALYAALAFGYSIAFAVTRRADVAYGALFAFAAQMFVLFASVGWTRLWLVLPAALAFRRDHDWWKVSADCTRLAQETAARLRELTGLPALSSPEFCAPQMVAMQIPPCDPQAVHDELINKYGIEIPVFEWQGRHIVRLSCQGYNTRAQMDVLIDALSELLQLRPVAKRASQG